MQYPKLSGWLAERRAVTKRAQIPLTNFQKFSSGGKRKIQGLATSISMDRVGDVVVPSGGTWKIPAPLLWQHSHKDPVGWVRSIERRGNGLWITAEFAEGFERADEVWRMVEAGLIDSFSIGFRPIKSEPIAGGGLRFTSWELLEISVVVVPANPDARISRAGRGPVSLVPSAKGAVKLVPGKPRGQGAVRLTRIPGSPIRLMKPKKKIFVPDTVPGNPGSVRLKTGGR